MGTSALRRVGSCLLGLLVSASGCLAGVALAGGAQAGGLTNILPTVGISTTVSTPAVTTIVPTPTLTVPTTVALPPVTTSISTTVTVPTTVAMPPVTTSVAVTVPSVSTPAVASVPPATVSVPALTVSASAQGTDAPVHAGVGVTVAGAAAATVQASVGSSATAGASAGVVSAAAPRSDPAGAIGVSVGSGPAGSAPVPGALPASSLAASTSRPLAARTRPHVRDTVDPALLSPLAHQIPAPPTPAGFPTSPTLQPQAARSASRWSGADTRRAALGGGLVALLALATLMGAGAVGSSPLVAACTELARFPFPRFRLLPCPGPGRAAAGGLEPGALSGSAGAPRGSASGAASAPAPSGTAPIARDLRPPLLPRIGGVLGAAVTKEHAWSIVKALVLAMLAVANALIVAVRWRLQRFQAR